MNAPTVEADRAVVLHGGDKVGSQLSARLAGHLSDGGVEAIPLRVTDVLQDQLKGYRGVIVVHASMARWPDWLPDVLVGLRTARRAVAVGRVDNARLPPELHGLPTLSLVPDLSYQPSPGEGGGYQHLLDIFGTRRPRGVIAPTAVFLSYSRKNSSFLDDTLVPILLRDRITYFDFKYTEKLDTSLLDVELERWVINSALVLVVATQEWETSEWCAKELRFACDHGKPVLAVWPKGTGRKRASYCGEHVPVISFGRDLAAADRRLTARLGRMLA